MDDDDLSRAVAMGMGIVLVRLSVRCPTRVPHAKRALQLLLVQFRFEIGELPLRADDFHAVAIDDSDAGAVVAPILEFLESGDENWHHITGADVSDDSAHIVVR